MAAAFVAGFNGFAGGRYGGNRASSEMTEQAGEFPHSQTTSRYPADKNFVGISRCLNLSAEIGLGATIGNKAGRIWVLAYQKGFTRGRRSELVVGACLYAACRREIVPPPIMLIDLSERLNGVSAACDMTVGCDLADSRAVGGIIGQRLRDRRRLPQAHPRNRIHQRSPSPRPIHLHSPFLRPPRIR